MKGALPPNSKEHFLRVEADWDISNFPTRVEPVNLISVHHQIKHHIKYKSTMSLIDKSKKTHEIFLTVEFSHSSLPTSAIDFIVVITL